MEREWAKLGAWVFKKRGLLPIPLVLLVLLLRRGEVESLYLTILPGSILVFSGLLLRFLAVGYIGPKSRTYEDETWYLVSSGPYAYTRNPLYVGNILIWLGLVFCSKMLWLLPFILVLAIAEYYLIVLYEEDLLLKTYGETYREYLSLTPRFIPRFRHFQKASIDLSSQREGSSFSMKKALEGERYTWLNVFLVLLFIVLKSIYW